MSTRNISWEIVVAGLTFVGIAIFLLNRGDRPGEGPRHARHYIDSLSVPPPLPPSIVIDLQNLENLKNLRNLKNLKNLENLEHLEMELQNLDKVIKDKEVSIERGETTGFSVDQSLQKLEKKLQELEKGDFNIKLQDKKIFINRRFKVEEASWSEISPGVYVYRKSFDLPNNKNVDLDLSFGNVNIVGGDAPGGEIVLQATGDVEDPDLLAKNMLMQVKQHNGNTDFSISSKDRPSFSDQINLEATVTVPKQTNFNVSTSGGHISVTNLEGNQQLETAGGHISLDDLSGTTYAKTSGGHITGDQIEGNITLTTSGGHIKIEKATGNVNLSTGGGHINIDQLDGEGQAKTSGGNISADIRHLQGPLELNTSAGNISLLLPRSINTDITARGTRTSISDAFDFNGTQTEGKIEGAINGGGVPITAHCGYGNVSIKTND